jgi:hypothetical protein
VRIGAAAGIAGIAAWVSYWHMVAVASRYGETEDAAHLLPLSVDGLVVVASVSLVELADRIRTATGQNSPDKTTPLDQESAELCRTIRAQARDARRRGVLRAPVRILSHASAPAILSGRAGQNLPKVSLDKIPTPAVPVRRNSVRRPKRHNSVPRHARTESAGQKSTAGRPGPSEAELARVRAILSETGDLSAAVTELGKSERTLRRWLAAPTNGHAPAGAGQNSEA